MKVQTLLAALAVGLLITESRAEDAPPDRVSAVKNATLRIKIVAGERSGSGSGLLIKVDSDVGYIVTSHFVARPTASSLAKDFALFTPHPPRRPPGNGPKPSRPAIVEIAQPTEAELKDVILTAIFQSGTDKEQSAKAEVVVADRETGLALLKVTGCKNLPQPPDLRTAAKVQEKMSLLVLGAPRADKPAPITIQQSSLAAIINDQLGETALLRVRGGVDVAMSGGVTVDDDGKLVGICMGRLQGGDLGIVVPARELARLTDGCLRKVRLISRRKDRENVEVTIEADVLDPFSRLKSPAVHYVPAEGLAPRQRDLAKVTGSKKVDLRVEGGKATGRVTLPLAEGGEIAWLLEPSWKTRDDRLELGEVESRVVSGALPLPDPVPAEVTIRAKTAIPNQVSAEVTFVLKEGQGQIRSAWVEHVRADKLGAAPQPDKDGRWQRIPIQDSDPKLIQAREGVYRLTFPLKSEQRNDGAVTFYIQIVIEGKDRQVRYLKPEAFTVDFGRGVKGVDALVKTAVDLPGVCEDVAVAGGGRFLLLSVPAKKRLLVFEVAQGKVVKEIPVEAERFLVTGGQDVFFILLSEKNVLERWSLKSFERETSVPSPEKGASMMLMGSASQGPLLLGQSFFDTRDLKRIALTRDGQPYSYKFHEGCPVRVSADGQSFGICFKAQKGGVSLRLDGAKCKLGYTSSDRVAYEHLIPSSGDRFLYGDQGLFFTEPNGVIHSRMGYCLPAASGPFFIELLKKGEQPPQFLLRVNGVANPVMKLSDVDVPYNLRWGQAPPRNPSPDLAFDKRIHLFPDAKVIVTIPVESNRLMLHKFDAYEALEKSDVNYLYLASVPPLSARRGEEFSYQAVVKSSNKEVEYRLVSGPEGVAVSREGKVTWKVPQRFEEDTAVIRIAASSAAKKQDHQTIRLAITGVRSSPVVKEPKPGEKIDVDLPGVCEDLAMAGGGRFLLLSIPQKKLLLVFDVAAAKIVKEIAVEEENFKCTGGRDVFFILRPQKEVLERWSLKTFEREVSVANPDREGKCLVMGSSSDGPLWIGKTFLDVRTMKPLPMQRDGMDYPFTLRDTRQVRASADGRTFGIWRGGAVTAAAVVSVRGNTWRFANAIHTGQLHQHIVPGPDGKWMHTDVGLSLAGIASAQMEASAENASREYSLPSAEGNFYFQLVYKQPRYVRPPLFVVFWNGSSEPLATLEDVEIPHTLRWGTRPDRMPLLPLDQRVHLFPDAKRIITIPVRSDRLVLHPFDAYEVLEKSKVNYFYFTSVPPLSAARGAELAYPLSAKSRQGDIRFRVESAPKGVQITPEGKVTWKVPKDHEEDTASLLLAARDGSGAEIFQHVPLSISGDREKPAEPQPVNPRPKAARMPLKAPALDKEVMTRRLPAEIEDAVAGGGGRFLIFHLPAVRRLAVFDVNEARVTGYIPLTGDEITFAAGADKLVVGLRDRSLLQRWDLSTLELEKSVKNPLANQLCRLCLGSASHGPALAVSAQGSAGKAADACELAFVDLDTLKEVDVAGVKDVFRGEEKFARGAFQIRASADNRIFGVSVAQKGQKCLIFDGKRVRALATVEASPIIPSADGRALMTNIGPHTLEGKPFVKSNTPQRALPAVHGPLYFEVPQPYNTTGQVWLRVVGDERPIVSLKSLQLPAAFRNQRDFVYRLPGALSLDKRVFFIPDASLAVTVQASADQIALQRVDVGDVLEKSGTDYLVILSSPPSAASRKAGFSYQPLVKSKRGTVRFKLNAGPEGMRIGEDGKISWQIPEGFKAEEAEVAVTVSDASGQEVTHRFTLRIED